MSPDELGLVTTSSIDGVYTVECSGDLTLFVVDQLVSALASASATGCEFVVDIRNAYYIDTAIIAALVTPAMALHKQGNKLKVLVADGGHPQRVLGIMGLNSFMNIQAELTP